MSSQNSFFFTLIRRISESLEGMSGDELKRLNDPQYSIEIRAVRRRGKDESPSAVNVEDVSAVIDALTRLASRQDAHSFLETRFPARRTLEAIARSLDIPIVRQDKVEDLREKIVESTVGARIRSQAIQGTSV